MLSVLKELEIIWNIDCVMKDNSEINNILCYFLADQFKELEITSEWNAQKMHDHCLDHIINLIVKIWLVNKKILDIKKNEELIWINILSALYKKTQDQQIKKIEKKEEKKKKSKIKEVFLDILIILHVIVFFMTHSSYHTDEICKHANHLIS